MTVLGIDSLPDKLRMSLRGMRCGLVCNQASVNEELIHSRVILPDRYGVDLVCLFSPQHGFGAEKQDNMIESDHGVDPVTGLPVFSLYGEHRKPTREMVEKIDAVLIDLIDVGTRVYTFMYTMAYCLEAAAEMGRRVIVLDRPNPIGGVELEGNVLKQEFSSFVGLYPMPMRHGMTMGELALYFNQTCNIGADLEVVPMRGWQRSMYFSDTGLPWLFPSPNMPTPTTAMVYPGQVIWEGTNVSEGRGTTMPFELVGAPYWETEAIERELSGYELDGCVLRPVIFEPTSGKWMGQPCCGFQLHVLDRRRFRPYRTSLALYQTVFKLYPDYFKYKDPPYEYEYEKLPMDLIIGDGLIRKQIEEGVTIKELEGMWQAELDGFGERRSSCLLYGD